MLDRDYYRDYCDRYGRVYRWLCENGENPVEEICDIRGYDINRMSGVLKLAGFVKVNSDTDFSVLKRKEFSDLGLFSENGNFLLNGRYIFPVRDMLGNVISLIGWYPDEKRYITTPSALFSKGVLFYGMEQLSESGIGGKYFLTEGIFDSLAIRALGYNAVAQMGISTSEEKCVLYGLFSRIIAVPDTDSSGLAVVKKDSWRLPVDSSYMTWVENGKRRTIKDIDDLLKMYDVDTSAYILNESLNDYARVITFRI